MHLMMDWTTFLILPELCILLVPTLDVDSAGIILWT